MFDRRWVTDVALAALIAFPALLPSSFAPASARSALALHSDQQPPKANALALALAQPDQKDRYL